MFSYITFSGLQFEFDMYSSGLQSQYPQNGIKRSAIDLVNLISKDVCH